MKFSSSPRKMSTKLYGKDLKEYEDVDIDTLLAKLTPEELEELNNEVDPDVSRFIPKVSLEKNDLIFNFFRILYCPRRKGVATRRPKNRRDRLNESSC